MNITLTIQNAKPGKPIKYTWIKDGLNTPLITEEEVTTKNFTKVFSTQLFVNLGSGTYKILIEHDGKAFETNGIPIVRPELTLNRSRFYLDNVQVIPQLTIAGIKPGATYSLFWSRNGVEISSSRSNRTHPTNTSTADMRQWAIGDLQTAQGYGPGNYLLNIQKGTFTVSIGIELSATSPYSVAMSEYRVNFNSGSFVFVQVGGILNATYQTGFCKRNSENIFVDIPESLATRQGGTSNTGSIPYSRSSFGGSLYGVGFYKAFMLIAAERLESPIFEVVAA